MTNATADVKTVTDEILGPVEYVTAEELVEKFQYLQPSSLYIRGDVAAIPAEVIDAKRGDFLKTEGSESVFRINEPLAYFIDAEGNRILVNGNTRKRILAETLARTEYLANYKFAMIPVRRFIDTPSTDQIIEFQIDSNDTTAAHSLRQKAQAILRYWESVYAAEVEAGVSEKTAQGRATGKTCLAFRASKAFVGQAKNMLRLPEWLLDKIDQGLTTMFVLDDVRILHDKLNNEQIWGYSQIWEQLMQLSGGKKVEPKHLKQLSKSALMAEEEVSNDSSGDSEGSEGSSSEESEVKKTSEMDTDKAVQTLEELLAAAITIDSDQINEAAIPSVHDCNKAITSFLSAVVKNGQTSDSKRKFEILVSALVELVTSDVTDYISAPDNEDLAVIVGSAALSPLRKLNQLVELINTNDELDSEESDDELDSEDSEDELGSEDSDEEEFDSEDSDEEEFETSQDGVKISAE